MNRIVALVLMSIALGVGLAAPAHAQELNSDSALNTLEDYLAAVQPRNSFSDETGAAADALKIVEAIERFDQFVGSETLQQQLAAQESAAWLGKWATILSRISFFSEELVEIYEGFRYESILAGTIETVGALSGFVAEEALSIASQPLIVAVSSKCAAGGAAVGALGGPIGAGVGAGLGFTFCYFGGNQVVGWIGGAAEPTIESALNWIFGRTPPAGNGTQRPGNRSGTNGHRRNGTGNNGSGTSGSAATGSGIVGAGGGLGNGTNTGGTVSLNGNVALEVTVGTITNVATNGGSATTAAATANAGDATVTVRVGDVTTIANGGQAEQILGQVNGQGGTATLSIGGDAIAISEGRASSATNRIAIAGGDNSEAMAYISGDVVTRASGGGAAENQISQAMGRNSSATATIRGDVSANASASGNAANHIAISQGSGSSSTVVLNGNVNTSSSGGNATNVVGVGQGDTTAIVGDDVTAAGQQAINIIATGSGRARIGGGVTTTGNAQTSIAGRTGSATVAGDVINQGGRLTIGGAGAQYSRNGQPCLSLYMRRYCSTRLVPPGKHGCPPRWYFYQGMCHWVPDFRHAVQQ